MGGAEQAIRTVNGYPGLTLHGTISNISDAVDPVSLTLKVRVVLQNPGHRLKPQMYANMTVTSQKRDVIVVPATAVIQNGHDTFVYVQTAPASGSTAAKYVRRAVTLGESHPDNDNITQGLSDGDIVVTRGAELLRAQEEQ